MKHLDTYINEFLVKGHTEKQLDYVDLDLPSGTLWAVNNLGADTIGEIGDFFMYGSVKPENIQNCDWKHCPNNGGSSYCDLNYFYGNKDSFVDDKGNLLSAYDAASQILKDGSHIPTYEQCKELLENTNVTDIDYEDHYSEFIKYNHEGVKLSSKVHPEKSIFIPCDYSSDRLDNYKFKLWSNTFDEGDEEWAFAITQLSWKIQLQEIERYSSCHIRPVKDK